jgi:hypothetical protein
MTIMGLMLEINSQNLMCKNVSIIEKTYFTPFTLRFSKGERFTQDRLVDLNQHHTMFDFALKQLL